MQTICHQVNVHYQSYDPFVLEANESTRRLIVCSLQYKRLADEHLRDRHDNRQRWVKTLSRIYSEKTCGHRNTSTYCLLGLKASIVKLGQKGHHTTRHHTKTDMFTLIIVFFFLRNPVAMATRALTLCDSDIGTLCERPKGQRHSL